MLKFEMTKFPSACSEQRSKIVIFTHDEPLNIRLLVIMATNLLVLDLELPPHPLHERALGVGREERTETHHVVCVRAHIHRPFHDRWLILVLRHGRLRTFLQPRTCTPSVNKLVNCK
jgi:hypothetical protein